MSKQTAPPKGWGEVSREELIKREFEMVKRIAKEEKALAQPEQSTTCGEPMACGGEQEASYIGHDCAPYMTDSMKVFCPACCTKFRAIPSDVQKLLLDAGFEPPFTSLHPSQPEQEPVAWMYEFYADMGHKGLAFEKQSSAFNKPLYFNPSQRTWIGLTDDELELLNDCGDTDSYQFARSIEAKLKEKNT